MDIMYENGVDVSKTKKAINCCLTIILKHLENHHSFLVFISLIERNSYFTNAFSAISETENNFTYSSSARLSGAPLNRLKAGISK
jgi:hypothetical protein